MLRIKIKINKINKPIIMHMHEYENIPINRKIKLKSVGEEDRDLEIYVGKYIRRIHSWCFKVEDTGETLIFRINPGDTTFEVPW